MAILPSAEIRQYGRFRPRPLSPPPFETELIHKLKDGPAALRAVMLEAPPGYGKNHILQAIYQQVEQTGIVPLWVSLDETDTTLESVIRLMYDGCRNIHPEIALPAFDGAMPAEPGRLIASLLSDHGCTIFLDNLEYCCDPEVKKFLNQIITLSTDGHIWIATSRSLGLDCTRQITEGRLLLLRGEDLSFSREDTRRFFLQRSKTELSHDALNQIQSRSRGWPLAISLLLTLLDGEAQPLRLIEQFSGRDVGLSAFLRTQFTERMDRELLRFMLSIAWFHPISTELCRYARKDPLAGRMIDRLAKENCYLFPLDRNGNLYEFHPLVRQFLIAEVERELEPELIARTLTRAIDWAQRRGKTAEAVEYALACRCPETISGILHHIAPSWVGQKGELLSYIQWVEQAKGLGASLTLDSEYWYLWALLFTRRHEAAFLQSESLWERSAHDQTLAKTPAKRIAFHRRFEELRILVELFRDRTDEASQKALRWLEDATAQNDISMATVACCVAINACSNFDFKTAREALHAAQSGCISANSDYGVAWVSVLCAEIDYYEGEYRHCHEELSRSLLRATEELGPESSVVSTIQLFVASCLLCMGQPDEAMKHLLPGLLLMPSHGISETTFCGIWAAIELWDGSEESPLAPARLEQLVAKYPEPMDFVFRCYLVRRLLRIGRMEEALLSAELIGLTLDAAPHHRHTPSAFVQELVAMTRLEFMLAKGLNRQAVALAEELMRTAESTKRRGVMVDLQVILAILAFRLENPMQSLRYLHRAIRLAAKRDAIYPFLARQDVLRIIFSQFKSKDWGFAEQDERTLFLRISACTERAQPPDVAPESEIPGALTARELELLRLADAGLSNQHIAERTAVALTTVKWHFSNIYSKLEVRNRSAATAKARSLKLF